MGNGDQMLELLVSTDGGPPKNIFEMSTTGIISHSGLKNIIDREKQIYVEPRRPQILPEQIQPASLDLRLGERAYRVRASFLPGKSTVMEKIEQLDGLPAIDLTNGAVLEKGIVYVVELLEQAKLTNGLIGIANPKSSTGRLDVLTRLITDHATAFDQVERKYEGPLYIEIAPLTFSIVVRTGTRLNQLRFQRGTSPAASIGNVEALYEAGQLVKPCGERLPLRGNLVPVTVDLIGTKRGDIVGYRAKKNTNKIDVDRVNHYDPQEFWEKIEATNGRLHLDIGEFYILATCEDVGVPPNLAAEMVAYDTASGEFRVHYAGFFDPGFGYVDGRAQGSRAVLEVRSHGVAFTLEHGQTVGWLSYSRLMGAPPSKVYGEAIKSHYQGQKVALSKHFKPWPR